MGKMCYHCMMPTVEGGVCRKCGEPELTAQGNGPKALPPGTTLAGGRVTVGKKLGSGGFGITYIAFDHKLNQRIALKEFLPNYMVDREGLNLVPKSGSNDAYVKAMNSFRKEARALYELRGHPNIVHVISTFRENNTAYYTMELLEGESLLGYLKHRKKISGEEAFKLLFPIMNAIRYMHKRSILHRDISPDNIMLCHDPDNSQRVIPKLIDFGAAHVAIEGFSASYPGVKKNGFSPLEQNWAGKYQGPWTDVYSLCATFYGSVIGTVPPAAVDRAEAQGSDGKGEDPLKPARQAGGDISAHMDDVLMKGLALHYQDRIQSMDDLMYRMTEARNQDLSDKQPGVTLLDMPKPRDEKEDRPVGRRIVAWIFDSILVSGISTAMLGSAGGEITSALTENSVIWLLPLIIFLLNWVLLKAARGTLGQLIAGLKIQRDDMSKAPMGMGYCLLYALLYPGLVGAICGLVYIASGKRIGPLEGLCDAVVLRRREEESSSMGSVVISRSVSRPVSQSMHVPTPSEPRPEYKPAEGKHSSGAHSTGGHKPETPPPAPPAPPSPPQPAVKAHLVVRRADDSLANLMGKSLEVHPGDTLGKNPQRSKIALADATISNLHCRFLYQEGRGWIIKDENSTNGTYVNEQRLPTGGMMVLKSGNTLRLGKELLEFRMES